MTKDELFVAAVNAYEAAPSHGEGLQAVIDMVLDARTDEREVSADPMMRNPNGTGTHPVRSVRVSEEIWRAARARAALEGVSISQVVVLLVLGYGSGLIDLPDASVHFDSPVKADA